MFITQGTSIRHITIAINLLCSAHGAELVNWGHKFTTALYLNLTWSCDVITHVTTGLVVYRFL